MPVKINIKQRVDDNSCDLSLSELNVVPVKDIAEFKCVTVLDLSCNQLTSLGDNFSLLVHLVKLDLSRNFIISLPDNFGNLINLRHLNLYGNKLEQLPTSFGKLSNLRYLDLNSNPINSVLIRIVGHCLTQEDCQNAARQAVNFMSLESEALKAGHNKQQSIVRSNINQENYLMSNDNNICLSNGTSKSALSTPSCPVEVVDAQQKTRKLNRKGKKRRNQTNCIALIETMKPEAIILPAINNEIYSNEINYNSFEGKLFVHNNTTLIPERKHREGIRPEAKRDLKPEREIEAKSIVQKPKQTCKYFPSAQAIILTNLIALNLLIVYALFCKNMNFLDNIMDSLPQCVRNWYDNRSHYFNWRLSEWISGYSTSPDDH